MEYNVSQLSISQLSGKNINHAAGELANRL
jgi:hypothetical protein